MATLLLNLFSSFNRVFHLSIMCAGAVLLGPPLSSLLDSSVPSTCWAHGNGQHV